MGADEERSEVGQDKAAPEAPSETPTEKAEDVSIEKSWKFIIPDWFVVNNVKRPSELRSQSDSIELLEDIIDPKTDDGENTHLPPLDGESTTQAKISGYKVLRQEYDEIHDTISSALDTYDSNCLIPEQGIIVLRADEAKNIDIMDALVSRLAEDIGVTLTSLDLIDLQSLSCDFDSQIRDRVRSKLPHPKAHSDYELPNLADVSLPNLRVLNHFAALSSTGKTEPLWDDGKGSSPRPVATVLEASSFSTQHHAKESDVQLDRDEDTDERTLVYIRDVDQILSIEKGIKCMENFGEALRERRANGHRIVLIISVLSGLCAKWSEEPDEDKEPSLLQDLRSQMKIQADSVIPVTQKGLSNELDKKQKERHLYARQIRCALRYNASQNMLASCTDLLGPNPKHDFACDPQVISILESETLSEDKAYRSAKLICGRLTRNSILTIEDIRAVLEIIHKRPQKQISADEQFRRKVKEIKEKCNETEKILLDCIVDTNQLDTKYEDVVMEAELKETVKELISLSRDSSQKHRLLQQAQIKGALFYGPPGTGKTHLTRAIARESGMSMLAVSAGNLEDMWVGNTEKRILATFSLARKLHPCILFFDEADSLFFRRGSCDKSWRRNAITLFLQEMDGLRTDKTSPFVIAATNRPKDLDDAFMRRLPYKAAFFLPTAIEREKILRVFLKDEDISDPFIFELLTRKTEGYSGADLKTLCGQAALIWSVEQSRTTSTEDVATEPTLKLTPQHFVKALRRSRPAATQETMKMNEDFQRGTTLKTKAR